MIRKKYLDLEIKDLLPVDHVHKFKYLLVTFFLIHEVTDNSSTEWCLQSFYLFVLQVQ